MLSIHLTSLLFSEIYSRYADTLILSNKFYHGTRLLLHSILDALGHEFNADCPSLQMHIMRAHMHMALLLEVLGVEDESLKAQCVSLSPSLAQQLF